MFDSFRSVYFAAKADPSCDAFCVPIPWYDRLPAGAFGRMHYDGDRYPKDIEVIDWREYDIESRHPDAAFIHYAYDDHNRVTSVHPDYYSCNLKSKTDCLTYIDYGIPFWMPKIKVDGNFLPVHVTCDVFVTYSDEYAEEMKFILQRAVASGTLSKHTIPKNNFVALGSPKFDIVINTNRENYTMPAEWQTLIADKKTILFSTSVGAILQGNEDFLIRLRAVFETFQNHKDIVLWWRPHPLSEATYASMRPQLLEEYRRIVKNYKIDHWGIYDDSPDPHRAIAWSDALYSDESSLLFLYLATGKPFTVRTFTYSPETHITDSSNDFSPILEKRIKNMQSAEGANVFNRNVTIWWHNFIDADFVDNVQYDNFLDRFIHFVLHESEYCDAGLYRQLKLQMFRKFVENPDGTAGQKIYEYIKQKVQAV
jgi:hypothetical protein